MKLVLYLIFTAIIPLSAMAQRASVGAPAMGYAFDASRGAIRPIHGIPGAAVLGDPLDAGVSLASASIAPLQNFALATTVDEPSIRLISWTAGKVSTAPAESAIARPDRILFSPSGSSALLISDGPPARLQVLTGLPGSLAVEEIDISSMTGPVGSAAISDDGKLVLLSDAGQPDAQGWLLDSDRRQVMLTIPGRETSFAFRANSHDAAAISRSGDLYVLQDLGGNSAVRNVAPGADETAGAVGLWMSSDGGHAYAATSVGNVTDFDLATGARQSSSCQCALTGVQFLKPGLFRLTEVSARPLMVLDTSAAPRIWFVPAAGGVE
jgi:hypothetical protein